ncbi:zinc finger BED domain-containing protein RICESLEEPER 2-like [Coffea eugenioides]|uniref:zinc finger BED domain-containing protein RICESLEEPER 2-like n=1 Tax=Coffea eugenioides TaxID=49369 RepID=UPI000F606791|nr:zinc finger BED domain-containing protein RICESLEEPER 2-like [Coffea eugenioides]
MREVAAHWILMHDHPFSILEEERFNMMMKRGTPKWTKISRVTGKNDCIAVYEAEKKKIRNLLRQVNKLSLTTDLWKAKNQKIEYMVITGHWIDANWKLQKGVLNFVHIPQPRRGVEISAAIFKCVKWGVDNKIYSISVDNASNNDVAVQLLKNDLARSRKLICGGKLFHVRCCTHILNLMVQDSLGEIEDIIENIRDNVEFVGRSDVRTLLFAEIAQQLQIPGKSLIHDCRTRWNSTYDMLSCAIKFMEVFPRYQDREPRYDCCSSDEEWEKVEKSMEIVKVKRLLDSKVNDGDDFIRAMVRRMKNKFDKYWGECNLLMAIAAILDPRQKMRVLEFVFSKIYSALECQENITKVKKTLFEMYEEYVSAVVSSSGSTIESQHGAS